jgi:hypothetical protein
MTTPAGWYPDPEQPTTKRYWDGQQWTENISAAASGATMGGFGRTEKDVTLAVAAVLERHSKTNPNAAKSRCSGGEVRCALPMDAETFTRHQARAVVEEVLFPALDSFAMQTHLVSQTLEQLSELGSPAGQNAEQRVDSVGSPPLRSAKPKDGGVLLWWKLLPWVCFVLLVIGLLVLNGALDAFH